MNAIISGKIIDTSNSMTFTATQNWEWKGTQGSHASGTMYILNDIYSTQYIRIIDKMGKCFLFALRGLSAFVIQCPTFSVQGINALGKNWETGICLGWSQSHSFPSAWTIEYYQYNSYNSASIDMAISSVEIGTLE